MKHILLFGATGRTGKYLLYYALQEGYTVTALVRDLNKIAVKSDRLKLVVSS
jgi:putative NADH-flavin reductase